VVVGILIALQVNNWNEQRKTEATIEQILSGVQEDLYNDIVELSLALDWHTGQDSISTRTIENRYVLDSDSVPSTLNLIQSGTRYYDIIISDRSFQLLSDYKDRIPDTYQPLMKRLNSIYVEDQAYFNTIQQQLINFTQNYDQYLYDNYEWYVKDRNWPSEQAIEYFLTSNFHKRQLSGYRDIMRGKTRYATRIREKAVINYMIIRSLLNDKSELPKFISDYGLTGDPIQGNYDGIFVYIDAQGNTERGRIKNKYDLLLWENLDDRDAFYNSGILMIEITPDSLQFTGATIYTISVERDANGRPVKLKSYRSGKPDREYVIEGE
jgi:hypothetical protein